MKQLEEIVHRSGRPFNTVVNEVLRAGIENSKIADAGRSYRLKPVAMGQVEGPYELDKALRLADDLEDEEIARKLLPGSLQGERPEADPPRRPQS